MKIIQGWVRRCRLRSVVRRKSAEDGVLNQESETAVLRLCCWTSCPPPGGWCSDFPFSLADISIDRVSICHPRKCLPPAATYPVQDGVRPAPAAKLVALAASWPLSFLSWLCALSRRKHASNYTFHCVRPILMLLFPSYYYYVRVARWFLIQSKTFRDFTFFLEFRRVGIVDSSSQ